MVSCHCTDKCSYPSSLSEVKIIIGFETWKHLQESSHDLWKLKNKSLQMKAFLYTCVLVFIRSPCRLSFVEDLQQAD